MEGRRRVRLSFVGGGVQSGFLMRGRLVDKRFWSFNFSSLQSYY